MLGPPTGPNTFTTLHRLCRTDADPCTGPRQKGGAAYRGRKALTVFPPEARRVTEVAAASRLTMGQRNLPCRRSGRGCACGGAGVVHGYLEEE